MNAALFAVNRGIGWSQYSLITLSCLVIAGKMNDVFAFPNTSPFPYVCFALSHGMVIVA